MRFFGGRSSCFILSKRVRHFQGRRPLCKTASSHGNAHYQKLPESKGKDADIRSLEAYRDIDKLDFMKAAKILFSDPPKKKKFGIDFHLVQLFFACMPSLAVYLVAQYARYEMRRMETELEVKKKAEEEKAKEMEAEQEDTASDSELLKVKERLEALEETVKDIVVETKKKGENFSRSPDPSLDRKDSVNRVELDIPATKGQKALEQAPSSAPQQMNKSAAAGDEGQRNQD